ncbi:MAG: hypothetical protein ACRDPY_14700 [Streptosporangiaceae bacterium]
MSRTKITAALGGSGTDPAGSVAVRAQFGDATARLATATKSARSGWRDLACAAVIALATRDGPAATDIYLAAAASTSAVVRDYGLMALAAEGDDRAWDPVLATVSEILDRKRISYGRWHEMLQAVEYLARHAAHGTNRAQQLISLLRANWGTLARPPHKLVTRGPYVEPEMRTATRLEDLWPGIQPDGPPADAIDLPRLHTPAAWWRPDFRPPSLRNTVRRLP